VILTGKLLLVCYGLKDGLLLLGVFDHVSENLVPFHAVLDHVSIISSEEARVKRFPEKLLTGTIGVAKLVAVPLLHDVSDGETIVHATVEVDSLAVLHDTDSTLSIVKSGGTLGDDEVAIVHVSGGRSSRQGRGRRECYRFG